MRPLRFLLAAVLAFLGPVQAWANRATPIRVRTQPVGQARVIIAPALGLTAQTLALPAPQAGLPSPRLGAAPSVRTHPAPEAAGTAAGVRKTPVAQEPSGSRAGETRDPRTGTLGRRAAGRKEERTVLAGLRQSRAEGRAGRGGWLHRMFDAWRGRGGETGAVAAPPSSRRRSLLVPWTGSRPAPAERTPAPEARPVRTRLPFAWALTGVLAAPSLALGAEGGGASALDTFMLGLAWAAMLGAVVSGVAALAVFLSSLRPGGILHAAILGSRERRALRAFWKNFEREAGVLASAAPEELKLATVRAIAARAADLRAPGDSRRLSMHLLESAALAGDAAATLRTWRDIGKRAPSADFSGLAHKVRRAAVEELERLARGDAALMSGAHEALMRVFPTSRLRLTDPSFWNEPPDFFRFGPLFDVLYGIERHPEGAAALAGLSPSAAIALKLKAYAALSRGEGLEAVRGRLQARAAELKAREERLKDWKPTVGIELELFHRYLKDDQNVDDWTAAAGALADSLGVRLEWDQMIEYSPGPGFDWRTMAELVEGFKEAGLLPEAEDDYSKLHINVVHFHPNQITGAQVAWLPHAQAIALLEGLLTAHYLRLEEGVHHLASLRLKYENINDIGGTGPFGVVRVEYLPASVGTGTDEDDRGANALHVRALKLVDTLHTGFHALLMDAPVEALPRELRAEHGRYWGEDADKKRRLAGLYREFHERLRDRLEQEPYRGGVVWDRVVLEIRQGNFTEKDTFLKLRENHLGLVQDLARLAALYVPLMDALVDEIATGQN